jgi:uncharacterized protein (TIGR02145 family)
MKMKFIYALALVASVSLFSCDKDIEPAPTPTEPTTVTIGGEAYPIVKIGTQSWTGVNYHGAGGAYFSPSAPKTNYGKLYTYAEVTAVTPPAGWRLPTKDDYINLLKSQGATFVGDKSTTVDAIKKVISTTGWAGGVQGTNTTNFNAFPAGYYYKMSGSDDIISNYEGTVTVFWTSSKTTDNNPYFFSISNSEVNLYNATLTGEKFSIRFVKDN